MQVQKYTITAIGRLLLIGAFLLMAGYSQAQTSTNLIAKLEPVPPFATTCAAAKTAGIPVTGIDPAAPGGALTPGDSVTGLITLHERKRHPTQWLVYFEVITNAVAAPAKPAHPMVVYTSTGNRFEFPKSKARMRVRTLGPFQEPNTRRRSTAFGNDVSDPLSVNPDFLGIGLDRGAAAVLRWNQASAQHGGTNYMDLFKSGGKPFGSSRTNQDRLVAAHWQVTPEEERAVIGWAPALNSYFDTVQETPDLQGILWKVVDLPSLWSFIRNRGVKVNLWLWHEDVGRYSPADWGLPSPAPAYSLPLTLLINQHKTLVLTMIVTAPRPPLLTCGGIIGFLAENPADNENYLTLRIISAHCQSGLAEKIKNQ